MDCRISTETLRTLDSQEFTGDAIDLCGLASGEHILVVSATDDSDNTGTASVAFSIEPQAPQTFVIKHMTIHWARDADSPGGKGKFGKLLKKWLVKKGDTFSLFGRLQLPEGYTVASLEKSAAVTIAIADGTGEDTVVFRERPLRRLGVIWTYRGDEQPPGEGMNITKMTIWWAPQGGKWAGFHLRGVLELPEDIGKDTKPAEATVTLEIPVTTEAGCGSLLGEETVAFKVSKKLNLWSYHVWPNLPEFRYDPRDTD